MFTKQVVARSIAIATLLSTMVVGGCGLASGISATPSPTPTYYNPYTNYTPTPSYATPTPTPQLENPTATVMSKTLTGALWCLLLCNKTVSAEVSVTNPNSTAVQATLTATFLSAGQTVDTQTQQVDLQPGQTQQVQVSTTKVSDDVQVYATLSTGCGSTGYPSTSTGYSSYPSTSTGYPSSSTGCSSTSTGYPSSTTGY